MLSSKAFVFQIKRKAAKIYLNEESSILKTHMRNARKLLKFGLNLDMFSVLTRFVQSIT